VRDAFTSVYNKNYFIPDQCATKMCQPNRAHSQLAFSVQDNLPPFWKKLLWR